MPEGYRLVVFDWDGTLVDSTGIIVEAIRGSAADLGLPVPSPEVASHVIGLGLADALALAVPGLPPERIAQFSARYRFHYLAAEARVNLFEGARALLARLRAEGVALAVATGKSRAGLDRAMRQVGLDDAFDATRCADETRPKPYPDMLIELVEALGLSPQDTLMVGDTTHDLGMARAAGAGAVALAHGAHPRAELARLEPLAIFDSLPEFDRWLRTP